MLPILIWQSVSDPNGLQEASTDTPQSYNMDNDGLQNASTDTPQSSTMDIGEEKNVQRHLEKSK